MATPAHIFNAHIVVHDAVIAHSFEHHSVIGKHGRKRHRFTLMSFDDKCFWIRQKSGPPIAFFSSIKNARIYLAERYKEVTLAT
jgi:hypothetical protein